MDVNTAIEMGNMPWSDNCWKVAIYNPEQFKLNFVHTIQYLLHLKDIKETLECNCLTV